VRVRRPILLACSTVVFLPLAGCIGLDTDPGLGMLQSVVAQGEALPEYARAAGGTATATVSGQIVGKLPCDELNAELKGSSRELRIVITLRADRNACNGIQPTTWSYIANLYNVPSGSHDLVVEHRYRGIDGAEGVVLDTVIVVG